MAGFIKFLWFLYSRLQEMMMSNQKTRGLDKFMAAGAASKIYIQSGLKIIIRTFKNNSSFEQLGSPWLVWWNFE